MITGKARELATTLETWAQKEKILGPGESLQLTVRIRRAPLVKLDVNLNPHPLPKSNNPTSLFTYDLPLGPRARKAIYRSVSPQIDNPTLGDAAKLTFGRLTKNKNCGLATILEVLRILKHYNIPSACELPAWAIREIQKHPDKYAV